MIKKIISWILVVGVIAFAFFAVTHYKKEVAQEDTLPEIESTAVFMNEEGKTVPAIFYDGAVMFNIEGLGDTVLPQTISGSGARYANEDENVIFWNKGDSVTITKDGIDIFIGTVYDKSTVLSDSNKKDTNEFSLSDSSWTWISTGMSNNTTITPTKKGVFSITLTNDGKVSGTTDCNSFGGTYTTGENNMITFSEFASTQMYCEGSQESAFIDMIGKADHFMFTNDGNLVLLLKYDSGSVMFRKK